MNCYNNGFYSKKWLKAYLTNKHLSIIYGDYFYIEALLHLNGLDIGMWLLIFKNYFI
jgi:hypothetical protein